MKLSLIVFLIMMFFSSLIRPPSLECNRQTRLTLYLNGKEIVHVLTDEGWINDSPYGRPDNMRVEDPITHQIKTYKYDQTITINEGQYQRLLRLHNSQKK